jgi:hypothetical protein
MCRSSCSGTAGPIQKCESKAVKIDLDEKGRNALANEPLYL